jgi:hypothetical protein
MKYGLAILWDGPKGNAELDDPHAEAIRDLVARVLVQINKNLKAKGHSTVDFTLVAKDEREV